MGRLTVYLSSFSHTASSMFDIGPCPTPCVLTCHARASSDAALACPEAQPLSTETLHAGSSALKRPTCHAAALMLLLTFVLGACAAGGFGEQQELERYLEGAWRQDMRMILAFCVGIIFIHSSQVILGKNQGNLEGDDLDDATWRFEMYPFAL
eukprot:TRINITY_DN8247_c0_g1_i2.p1 TRINITY_DN8247_c0_g1~~TRINITY_DN8247_c0_g1_i2.p1  ORF type:complete len:153 (+),score=24.56 TRINITY_DN8247_c0_g1_i2:32-490(+)